MDKPATAHYLFICKDSKPDQQSLAVILLNIKKINPDVVFVHTSEYSPIISDIKFEELDGLLEVEAEDEDSADEKALELANTNKYQVVVVGKPVDTEIAFMRVREKTTRQRLREKKLFKFAKAIIPKRDKRV